MTFGLHTKKVINSLAVRAGMPIVYAEADLQSRSSSVTSMRRDQFYGKSLTTALREYLVLRAASNMGPATVTELFDGLTQGGFDHGSANDDNARRVIRITLTKNSGIFHRLPDDKHFGLTEWYPAIRAKRAVKEGDKDEGADEAAACEPQVEVKVKDPSELSKKEVKA